jgi:hypothetical protein
MSLVISNKNEFDILYQSCLDAMNNLNDALLKLNKWQPVIDWSQLSAQQLPEQMMDNKIEAL